MALLDPDFATIIGDCRIVVCVGSGGVGKTTTSAVLALNEALEGRRVLVLTIDPARRLANSLGIEAIGNEPTRIPLERFEAIGVQARGELWAMMLDMKESFDHLVRTHAPAEARQEILDNRIYEYFSTSLAGAQEYAAAVRLHELYETGRYDLIVLDTPPTTHALDFLEAPNRLADAIDNRALQWLYKPGSFAGRTGLGIFSMGTSYVLKTLAKFTGTQLLDEISVFLRSFSTLFDNLKERSRAVRALLMGELSTFVVVTAPDPPTIEEALYFYRKLGDERVKVGGFVVNRIHGHWVGDHDLSQPTSEHEQALREASSSFEALAPQTRRDLAEQMLLNAREFEVLADIDDETIELLRRQTPLQIPIQRVPFFATDIHSLEGLDRARRALFST